MKSYPLLFLLVLLLAIGCRDDDDTTPQPQPVQTATECNSSCNGVGRCDELNRCYCPEGVRSIAPGFCIQSADRVIFVSYDTVRGLIDTMIMELDVEPFEEVWVEGESAFKPGFGKVYARNPYARTLGNTGPAITYVWDGPRTPRPVDSVWISGIYSEAAGASLLAQSRHMYNEDWNCSYRIFVGRFTDYNTITGDIELTFCRSVVDNPVPDTLPRSILYPITWHRLE